MDDEGEENETKYGAATAAIADGVEEREGEEEELNGELIKETKEGE